MAHSGELTLSRSKNTSSSIGNSATSSSHRKTLSSSGSRHYRTVAMINHGNTINKPARGIVVQEPDEDSSRHTKRIDQGILDASREGLDLSRQRQRERLLQQSSSSTQQQGQSSYASWWSAFSYGGTPVVSPGNELDRVNPSAGDDDGNLARKTTVSRTFRVP